MTTRNPFAGAGRCNLWPFMAGVHAAEKNQVANIVATRLQAQAAMARELASVANCGQRFSSIPHGNHGDNNQTSLTS